MTKKFIIRTQKYENSSFHPNIRHGKTHKLTMKEMIFIGIKGNNSKNNRNFAENYKKDVMKHCKALFPLLTFLVMSSINSTAVPTQESIYTCAQVDSIVSTAIQAEFAKQVTGNELLNIKIENAANERLGTYITEQNNHLTKHDTIVGAILTIIGILFAALAAYVGIYIPLSLNKEREERLKKNDEMLKEIKVQLAESKKTQNENQSQLEQSKKTQLEIKDQLKQSEEKLKKSEKKLKESESKLKEFEDKINEILKEVNASKEAAQASKDEAEQSAKDAILSRNMSHNIGENVMKMLQEVNASKEAAQTSKDDAEQFAKEAKASQLFAQALNEKAPLKAIELYSQAIIIKPDFFDAYINRGILKWNEMDAQADDALADFNKAIELNPDNAIAYYNRGILKFDMDDKPGALKDFDKAIELNPDYPDAYYDRGILKELMDNLTGALDDYNIAVELKPDDAFAYNNRGKIKFQMSDLNGALADYSKAIELMPHDFGFVYADRAELYRNLADKEQDKNKKTELRAKAEADEHKAKELRKTKEMNLLRK